MGQTYFLQRLLLRLGRTCLGQEPWAAASWVGMTSFGLWHHECLCPRLEADPDHVPSGGAAGAAGGVSGSGQPPGVCKGASCCCSRGKVVPEGILRTHRRQNRKQISLQSRSAATAKVGKVGGFGWLLQIN